MNILEKAASLGIIDTDALLVQVEEMEKKQFLQMHQNAVWQDSKGRWTTYLPETKEHKRRLVKKTDRVDLDMQIIEFYKTETENPTLDEVFQAWIQDKVQHKEVERQTLDRYTTDYERFFAEFGKQRMKDITEFELEDFIKDTIAEKQLTAKAWSNLRIIINGVFKYGKRRSYTQISITSFMGDLELSKKAFKRPETTDEKQVFTNSEIEKIYAEIAKEKQTLLTLGIKLTFQTGLRAGELATLKYSDLEDHKLKVSRTEVRHKENGAYIFGVRETTKGRDGYREIYITDEALETIKQIRRINPFTEYIFEKNGKLMHGHAFSDKCSRLCRAAGVTPKSLHKIRKTYATKLLNAGVPEKLITKQMGHTDIETTKKYYCFDNMEAEKAQKCIQAALQA